MISRTISRMSSQSTASVVTERIGHSLSVLLNRPKALNALDLPMCKSINTILKYCNAGQSELGVLVVKGSGGKAFCAGGDVKSVQMELANDTSGTIGSGRPGTLAADFFREEYEMNYLLGSSRIPQVSIWDGIVMGGGVGVSVLGRYRVATEKTLFAMPETAIGLFPDVGSSSWLPHIDGGVGLYLGLTGCRLSAADLVQTGIATHYVSSEALPGLEQRLAEAATGDPEESTRRVQAVLDAAGAAAGKPDDAKSKLAPHTAAIRRCFEGASSVEGIIEKLQVERSADAATAKWAEETLATLAKMSPTSLKLTLQQLQRGRNLDLAGCLIMEFRMVQRCMRAPDFAEGIRALLVDKDHSPRWNPASLALVQDSDVEQYFEPLGPGGAFDLDLSQHQQP